MTSPPASAPTALVPLRSGGKTRLGPQVTAGQRAALAAAMLSDVRDALRDAGIERVVVAAKGATAVAAARELGVEVLIDEPDSVGLDDALERATARLVTPGGLLIVAADLPRLRGDDIHRLLRPTAEVVVAPTADGGTGGLLRRPADVIATAYGPDSAARHQRLARAAGAACALVTTPGLSHDVDTLPDLVALDRGEVGPATARALARSATRAAG